MSDLIEFDALLADLRSLVQQSLMKGDQHDPKKSGESHYWYGVKVGYEDAAERLETLLRQRLSDAALPVKLTPDIKQT